MFVRSASMHDCTAGWLLIIFDSHICFHLLQSSSALPRLRPEQEH
jgi:hypothetical protein